MKSLSLFVAIGSLVLMSPAVLSSAGTAKTSLQSHFKSLTEFRVTRSQVMSTNYADTECVDFSFKRSRERIGFICVSKSPDFVRDMGISAYDALPTSSRPNEAPATGLVVSTPMSQYAMTRLMAGNMEISEAHVDCDTLGEAIYRATSTCHVAVSSLGAQPVYYGSFVVTNHLTKKPALSAQRIRGIWQKLDLR